MHQVATTHDIRLHTGAYSLHDLDWVVRLNRYARTRYGTVPAIAW